MATTSENVSAATRSMAGDVFEELVQRFRNENPTFRISDDVIRRYHLATSTRARFISSRITWNSRASLPAWFEEFHSRAESATNSLNGVW